MRAVHVLFFVALLSAAAGGEPTPPALIVLKQFDNAMAITRLGVPKLRPCRRRSAPTSATGSPSEWYTCPEIDAG